MLFRSAVNAKERRRKVHIVVTASRVDCVGLATGVKKRQADKRMEGRNRNHGITRSKKYLQPFHATQLDALECACHEYFLSIGASIVVR